MSIGVRAYEKKDIPAAIAIWNRVVEDGAAFPQLELLTAESGAAFFAEQSFTGVAYDTETGEIVGMYILHPNNVGRCGHIANASYAVKADRRGQHIGEALVTHCLQQGKTCGFRVLQFNAVVASNHAALRLYQKLGFEKIGIIPGGYRSENGYEDILIFFHEA